MNSLLVCFIIAVSLAHQALTASVPANPDTSKPNPGSDVVAQGVPKLSERAGSFKNRFDDIRERSKGLAAKTRKNIKNETNTVVRSARDEEFNSLSLSEGLIRSGGGMYIRKS